MTGPDLGQRYDKSIDHEPQSPFNNQMTKLLDNESNEPGGEAVVKGHER